METVFERMNGKPASMHEIKRRKEHVKRITIKHPMYRRLEERIHDYHEMSKGTILNDGIFISGDTGMGKTTVLKGYLDKNPAQMLTEKTIVPVVYVRVPVGSSIKALASRILEGFGDPLFDKGTELNMLSRIYRYLKVCEVELIIFDEFQHLIDSDTQHVLHKVSNWMKTFIETIERPVILCGMPESEHVFTHNAQLDRRFCHRFELTPFKYEKLEQQKEFRSFLFNIDKQLPFAERTNLADIQFAERLFYASLGVPFYVMKILEEATEYATRFGMDRLSMECLSEAFESIRLSSRPFLVNPFTEDFNFLEALDKEEKRAKQILKRKNQRDFQ